MSELDTKTPTAREEPSVKETRLTDEGYWEHFWGSVKTPSRINTRGSIDRCLSRMFLKFVPEGRGKRLIEIGAAPGRWLVFFQEKLGYDVDGIEFVESACRTTEQNLAACGARGRMYHQDFFANDLPQHSYDAVLSIGFIEHFTDPGPAVAGHINLLKPGGVLILEVPNLRGIHGAAERLTDPDTFAAHSLDVMRLSFMEGLSAEYDLSPIWIGYIGGISPGLLTVAGDTAGRRRKRSRLLRFVLRALNFIRNRITFLDHWNGPGVSSNLLAIYRYTPPDSGGLTTAQEAAAGMIPGRTEK